MSAGDLVKLGEGREAEIFSWDERSVVRLMRDPRARPLAEQQAAAMAAAREAGCPVPWVGDIVTVRDRPGLVMERVDGPDLLGLLTARPWRLVRYGRLLARIHTELHGVRAPSSLPDTRTSIRRRIEASGLPADLAAFALGELERLPDGERLCHGDYHPGNVLIGRDGPLVIDWTGATRGDPAADVARTLLLLRAGEPLPGTPAFLLALIRIGRKAFARLYLKAYLRLRPPDVALVDRWAIPHAAARLAEGIEAERVSLVRWLEARAGERARS